MESRLLLSVARDAADLPFCGPLAIWPHAGASSSHAEHDPKHKPHHHHHKGDDDRGSDGDNGTDDGGESDGESDLVPALPVSSTPDGTGSLADQPPPSLVGGSWTFIGPAPVNIGSTPWTGRIAALAAHPTDANTIYVAAAGGGVWKTTNGGTSWTPLTDSQSTLFMGSIAIAPSDPNTIYAGTGEANNSIDSFYGRGVLKSSDGGTTWSLMGNSVFDRRSIAKIVVDPTNRNIVYAAVGGFPPNGFSGNRGVWKSTDGGATWANTTTSITTSENFSDLAIDPANPQVLYAAVGRYNGSALNGIYKSTNGGASWSIAGDFATGSANGRITLALAPSDTQTIYAAVTSPTTFGLARMMKSTDAGATWTQLTSAPNNQGGQGWYDTTLIVDPSDAKTVYSGGAASGVTHVMKTSDGGVTWTGIATGGAAPHVDHHAIGFDAAGKLLDGNDGGIWRLNNPNVGSIAWANINSNLGTLQFEGIAIHPTNPGIAYGGTQDNGTLQYQGALGWTLRDGGDGGDVAINTSNPSIVYHIAPIASFGTTSFFRRSDNGGLSWQDKTTGLAGSDPGNFYPPFVMDSSNSSRLLLGTNRIYETTNNADSWAPLSTPGLNGWDVASVIDAIAPAPSDSNVIYASANGATYVTTNHGASWTRRDIPGGSDDIVDMAVDPADSMIAYAVRDRFGGGKVFRTVNGGVSWTNISGNLPDVPANALAIDFRNAGNSDDVLYVGTDTGVFDSTNVGLAWNRVGSNFPNADVIDLEFAPAQDLLAAGTHGRGVWETSTAFIAGGTGSIAGQVFGDTNGNGSIDTGEVGMNGVTVFLDLNNSGTFDGADATTITSGNGNYSFAGLSDGTYSVGEVTPSGYVRPGGAFVSVTVSSGSAATGKNLANIHNVYTGTAGNDQYTIRVDPTNSANVQVIETLFGQSQVTNTIPKSAVPLLTFNTLGGDDQITLDYSNGVPIPSAGLNIDLGAQTNGDNITLTGSGGADNIVINSLDVVGSATGGSIAVRNVEHVTINGNAGNDSLTLGSGVSFDTNFAAGSGADSLTYNGTDNADSVYLAAGAIINGNETAFQGVESLTVNTMGGNDILEASSSSPVGASTTLNGGSGNDTLNIDTPLLTPLIFNGGLAASDHDILNVNKGTFTFAADAALGTSNLSVNVAAADAAVFNASQHLQALNISGGQVFQSYNGSHVLVTRSLSITGGGFLDLSNNDLVVDYTGGASPLGTWTGSAYTAVTGLLAGGYGRGAWDGGGIRTSAGSSLNGLGVAEASAALNIANAQTHLFDGQTVDASAIIVKYTYVGDASLDGKLDISDLGRIDFNIPLGTAGWFNGDFNYDGKIDISDYGMMDFALPIQGPPV